MDKRLLDILCCPVSKTPLRLLRRDELKYLNQAISAGGVDTVDGERATQPLAAGLITVDGKVIYRIDDDVPILLPEAGMGTTQLSDFPPARP